MMALFGVALFEATEPTCSPADRYRTLALLTRATEGTAVALALRGADLTVNGRALSVDAPGTGIIQSLLRRHGIGRLQLPAAMGPTHWEGLVDLLTRPPGAFLTPTDLAMAVHRILPLAEIVPPEAVTPDDGDSAPGPAGNALEDPAVALAQASESAVLRRDATALAHVLLAWSAEASAATGDRRRHLETRRSALLAPATLTWLIDAATANDPSGQIAVAIGTLGELSIDPILQAMSHMSSGRERDRLASLLGPIANLDQALLPALRGDQSALVVAATEVAGRHRLAGTVPPLAALLRSPDETIRTTAWHALEAIGTREAVEALRLRSR